MNHIPSSAALSDALRQLGFPFQALRGSFRAPFSPVKLSGPAYTVRCYAGATWALEQAIEKAPEGSVLVVDGGGFREAVLMGGLMSLRARMRGIAGAVIDGAVRDTQELIAAAWPLFSTATTPRAGTTDAIGDLCVPISCGGVSVSPGDHVIGDDDGVVIIPSAQWEAALQTAIAIEEKERFIESKLMEGRSIPEAITLWKNRSGCEKGLH